MISIKLNCKEILHDKLVTMAAEENFTKICRSDVYVFQVLYYGIPIGIFIRYLNVMLICKNHRQLSLTKINSSVLKAITCR